ncbi:MAG: methyltransferase domain-containing protein [Frankiaceae bacterium]|nr:methyltransferase domain-containing protein [Frankiaceae bacterium]MBV9870744.1 methyltransferase domain-containing protein [Frankiaceae bacterium]
MTTRKPYDAGSYRWDPAQYLRFAEQRDRPFRELVERIPVAAPTRVVDLGCGPGLLTRSLAERWPQAHITGVDRSADMIAASHATVGSDRVDFVHADLRYWEPDEPVDVVLGNAVLQWVPNHLEHIATLAGWIRPGGALAFQVPDNFSEPSHTVIRALRLAPRWRDRLGDAADRSAGVERPETYLTRLAGLGLTPDVWQTEYLHLLPGDDAVLEWVKGTALRPVLDALADDPPAAAEFLEQCGAALREQYPRTEHGTVFPFRRTFLIGARPPE